MFKLTLIRSFQLEYQNQTIRLDHRPRLQSLLAFLALNRQRPQTRAEIINALWSDTSEARGRNRLRNLLYQLRQTLPAWEELIIIKSNTLHWRLDASNELDIAHFETLLTLASQQSDLHHKELRLKSAIDQYAGELFPTCVDEWIQAQRTLFHNQLIDALGQLIGLTEARQAWDDAQHYAERLLMHDPLHEATYCRVMQLHARQGDIASVMRTYDRCCKQLADELNVEPNETTKLLYKQLVTPHATLSESNNHIPHISKPAALIGRNDEWNELQQIWQRVQTGDSRLVLLQGEAGIGKTRLYQDFLHWAEEKEEHIYTASASCYAVEGTLAFAPVAEWLRTEPFWQSLSSLEDEWLAAIVRLLPELHGRFRHLSNSIPPEKKFQRQHFYTSLAVALLEHGQPVLLCLDDLQWSDQETLNWLHYLIRYETPTPLLVLATLRTDDAADRARCQPLLHELARHNRLNEINLTRLSINDTVALAQQMLGSELYTTYAAQLYHETDGNPFFIVETVRAHPRSFVESTAIEQTETAVGKEISHHLPSKIRALIEKRLARLSPLATEVMQFAAVIGRRFDYALLVAATKHSERELMQGVEELWEQHIVTEVAHNSFDFIHNKVLIAAYAQISPVRRRFLHQRIATILASNQDEQSDDACIQIAQHYHQAGSLGQAASYYQRAVHAASRRYAIESLLSASTIALELLQKLDPDKQNRKGLRKMAALIDERVWSWEMVGDMDAYLQDLTLLNEIGVALADDDILNRASRFKAAAFIRLGRYREAEAAARQSADIHQTAGLPVEEGISLTIVGRALRELGEYHDAVSAFHQALRTLAQANAHNYRIQAYSYLSTTYWQMGEYQQALQCGEKSLTICEEHNMPERKRFALGDMGAAAVMLGQTEMARQWLHESLQLAEILSDFPQMAFCRGHLGWLALREEKFEQAKQELETAYELSQSADTIGYACWLLRGLAELAMATGQYGQAHTLATKALSIAKDNQQANEQRVAQILIDKLG